MRFGGVLGSVPVAVGVTQALIGLVPSWDLSTRGCRHRPGIGAGLIRSLTTR
jgi:hypothetical protein